MQRVRSTRDILIQTERSEEARAFYEGVLGFPVVHDDPAMCGLDTGSFCLFIDPAPSLGPVLEFAVGNLADIKARLLAAGCSVIEDDPAIPRCYVRDPFGLIFNLRETSTSSGATGQRLEQQNLGGALFQDCSLAQAEFDDIDLSRSQFSNVRLDRATFTNVSLAGVTIDNADIAGLTIFGHDIQALISAELARRRNA